MFTVLNGIRELGRAQISDENGLNVIGEYIDRGKNSFYRIGYGNITTENYNTALQQIKDDIQELPWLRHRIAMSDDFGVTKFGKRQLNSEEITKFADVIVRHEGSHIKDY